MWGFGGLPPAGFLRLLPWDRVWPRPQWDRFGGTLYRGWVVFLIKILNDDDEGRNLTFVPGKVGETYQLLLVIDLESNLIF